MDAERSTERTGRLAPLAQAGLAALVAGSLLTFSTIAFRTAFDGSSDTRAVAVSAPRTASAEPVVLPTPPRNEPKNATVAVTGSVDDDEAEVLGLRIERRTPSATRVRVTRPGQLAERSAERVPTRRASAGDDDHKHPHGKGHEKARGEGHHKDHKDRKDHDAKSHGRAKGKKKH